MSRSGKIERAIEWNIFEVQARLISSENLENVSSELLPFCKKWFTPSRMIDVITERSNEKRCGYPMCIRILRELCPRSNTARTLNEFRERKRQSEHEDKREGLENVLEVSHFCSSSCHELCQILVHGLDNRPPLVRECAKMLTDIEIKSKGACNTMNCLL